MQTELQVTFHTVKRSEAVVERIRHHLEKLERAFEVRRCHVTVTAPHHHRRHGEKYAVGIILAVGGDSFVVSHTPRHLGDDLYASIDAAFAKARRLLETRVRRSAA